MKSFSMLAVILLLPATGFADTIHVPGQSPTIQDAIDSAMHHDTILVAPGTYVENLNFNQKKVVVRSDADGDPSTHDLSPETTIIDGNQAGSVVIFESAEGSDTVIEGFTVTNGTGTSNGYNTQGGGVLCRENPFPTLSGRGGASPQILNNIITGNQADYGAGICCDDQSSPSIIANTITSNESLHLFGSGGGICCNHQSNAVIAGNFITSNSAKLGGGVASLFSEPILVNDFIVLNTADLGAGIMFNEGATSPEVTSCTIVGNFADQHGGGIFCWNDTDLSLTNCILWGNEGKTGGHQLDLRDYVPPCSTMSVSHSAVQGGSAAAYVSSFCELFWDSGSTIETNPSFVDFEGHDFHLSRTSPCINRGSNRGAPPCDYEGDPRPAMGIVDMGADEFTGAHLLAVDVFALSAAAGGGAELSLDAGAENGNREYFVLGSSSGTVPGIPLHLGLVTLPLNWDLFSAFVAAWVNTPVFSDFQGMLDAAGQGSATLTTKPLRPEFVGLPMYFAFTLLDPCDFVSNPVKIQVVP